jgi:hypothetical protein|tara:strand:- start:689 stop:886 length:198 start_codon:yes stop_codon:yes gene_type:complete
MKARQTGTNTWVAEVQENGKTKELFIEFPQDAIDQAGWADLEDLEWIINDDQSVTLRKANDDSTT